MIRPLEHLTAAGKLYPNAWPLVDEFRQDRGKGLPNWPNWCFLPMSAFYAIVSSDAKVDCLPLKLIGDVARLSALGTWRISQGVYRVDPDLAKALIDSPITGSISMDVLYRLPEWCIYVETPEYSFNQQKLYGFFVHLEWDVNTTRTELRFLMDGEKGLLPFVLHLGPWTVTEALDRATSEASKQAVGIGLSHEADMDVIEHLAMEVRPLVSLLLYLCSETPEYHGSVPSRPAPKKTKKGWRLFPPPKPKIIEIGKTIGAALRAEFSQETTEGKSKRPHIRRGHWHGFWTGKKDSEQKFIYKWLPPNSVNVETLND